MKLLFLLLFAIPSLSQAATPTLAMVICGRVDMYQYRNEDPAAIKLADSASESSSAEAWLEKAARHHRKGEDAERDRAVEAALAKMKAMPVSAESASSLNDLAYKYLKRGMCVQAEAVYELAFPMLVQTHGWASADMIAAIKNRAASLLSQKNPAAREALYRDAAAAIPPERSLAFIYTELAKLELGRKEYGAAEKSLGTAIRLYESSPNDKMLLRRVLLDQSGVMYRQLRYADGERLTLRAYAIAPNRYATKSNAEYLPGVLFRRGDIGGALALVRAEIAALQAKIVPLEIAFAKAVESERDRPVKVLKASSHQLRTELIQVQEQLLVVMIDEAEIQHSQGDLVAADAKYGAAQVLAVALKSDHLSRIQRARARLYRAEGKLAEAMALQEGVLAARADVDGEAHPDTIDSRTELAELCEQLGTFDCAASNREVLAHAYQKSLRPQRAAQRDNLARLAFAYRKLERADDADKTTAQIATLNQQ